MAWAPPGKALSTGLEVQFQSGMRTLAGARTDDAAVVNVHLSSGKLFASCEVALTASNLFDARYGNPGAEDHVQDEITQPGRVLRLMITRRF